MRVGLSKSYPSLTGRLTERITDARYVCVIIIHLQGNGGARFIAAFENDLDIDYICAATQPFNTLRQQTMFHARLAAAM